MTVQPNTRKPARQSNIPPRLLGLILILGSLLVSGGVLGWFAYVQSWPTADAVITSSTTTRTDDGYSVRIQYRYTIDGQTYTGTYNKTTSSQPGTVSEGSIFPVVYNPGLPQVSFYNVELNIVLLLVPICCLLPFGLIIIGTTFLPDQSHIKIINPG
jgi:hypothetical protein